MPTAPEIVPTATPSKAAASRSALRWASKAKPASLMPKVVGSAWTPCVRPTHSVLRVLAGARDEAADELARAGDDDLAGRPQLQRQRRVEHVGGGQAVVDPAPARAGGGRQHVDEGGDVVVGDALALGDRLDGEARRADRLEVLGARALHLLAGRDLDARQYSIRAASVHRAPISGRV